LPSRSAMNRSVLFGAKLLNAILYVGVEPRSCAPTKVEKANTATTKQIRQLYKGAILKLPIISRLHDSCIPLVFNVRQLPILFETSRYNFEAMILIEALSVLVALECEEAQTTVGFLFR